MDKAATIAIADAHISPAVAESPANVLASHASLFALTAAAIPAAAPAAAPTPAVTSLPTLLVVSLLPSSAFFVSISFSPFSLYSVESVSQYFSCSSDKKTLQRSA